MEIPQTICWNIRTLVPPTSTTQTTCSTVTASHDAGQSQLNVEAIMQQNVILTREKNDLITRNSQFEHQILELQKKFALLDERPNTSTQRHEAPSTPTKHNFQSPPTMDWQTEALDRQSQELAEQKELIQALVQMHEKYIKDGNASKLSALADVKIDDQSEKSNKCTPKLRDHDLRSNSTRQKTKDSNDGVLTQPSPSSNALGISRSSHSQTEK